MKTKNEKTQNNFFQEVLEEAYYRKAWHGPNLHSSLKGVTAADALKRPLKDRHNIYEVTIHAAYGVYRIMQRIKKNPGIKFPLKGNNWWFESPDILTESEWKKERKFSLSLKSTKTAVMN